jgi:hypothetical protein
MVRDFENFARVDIALAREKGTALRAELCQTVSDLANNSAASLAGQHVLAADKALQELNPTILLDSNAEKDMHEGNFLRTQSHCCVFQQHLIVALSSQSQHAAGGEKSVGTLRVLAGTRVQPINI